MTQCRQSECRAVTVIAIDSPPEQFERLGQLVLLVREGVCQCTQIQVVGGQVSGRPLTGSTDFSDLQCRLNHSGDARRDLILKIKYVLQRSIETIGPKMSPALR